MTTTYDTTKDPHVNEGHGTDSIGVNGTAIVPSDTADLASYPRAVCVTATGDLKVLPLIAADDGAHTVTFAAAPVGFIPPFRVRRVFATGTTASVCSVD